MISWKTNLLLYVIYVLVAAILFTVMGYEYHVPTALIVMSFFIISGILNHFTEKETG